MLPLTWVAVSLVSCGWSAYFFGELGLLIAASIAVAAVPPLYWLDTRYL